MRSDADVRRWAESKGDEAKDDAALATLQREAKAKGAKLAQEGKGGIPSTIALEVFRKADYKCARCDTRDGISLHHKGGIVHSERLDEMGHKNIPENVAVLCESCHDFIHGKAREKGIDSSQIEPRGDR